MSDTDEDIQKAIAEAVAIVREDRFEKFVRGRMTPESPADDGKAPPAKPEEPPELPKAKKSLWWGEALDETPESPTPPGEPKDGN